MPSLLFPQFRSLLHERQLERHQGIPNTRRHVFVHGGRDRGPSRPGLGSPWPRKRERFSSGRQQRRRYRCHAESGSRAKSSASRIGYDAFPIYLSINFPNYADLDVIIDNGRNFLGNKYLLFNKLIVGRVSISNENHYESWIFIVNIIVKTTNHILWVASFIYYLIPTLR